MAGLPNNTFAAPGVPFYAISGGAAASLQSPVNVIPNVLEDARINVNAGVGGSAIVTVIGSATNTGIVGIGGYGESYTLGVTAAGGAAPSVPAFSIGAVGEPNVALSYDPGTHILTLSDNDAAGIVFMRNAIAIGDPQGGANQLTMTPLSGTESVITQTVAQGTLSIGASSTNNNILEVSDVPKNGAANYVEINGAVGQVPLFISAAQGVGGNCYIYPDSPGGASVMNVGSSQINPSAITMTDNGVAGSGRTVIANLAPPSLANNICTINGQQATIPNTTSTIVLPAGVTLTDGLYYFAVNITGVGNPQFQASCIVYYNGSVFSTGGSVQSSVDGNGKYLQMYPAGGNMQISFNGTAALPGYVVLCPLFNAAIIGFA